jgi:RES domain-containing protein
MKQAYRIVREKFAAAAFTGEGAALTGGRWNSRGFRMVYTSASASLAALETLVHLNPAMRFTYQLFIIEFDESLVKTISPADLLNDWREQPPPPSTRQIGDAWIKSARSAVLEVPSVIIPGESNYLLNPSHPDFSSIHIGKPQPFCCGADGDRL